ncbi:MAG: bifunctional 5,10-methylenetetrahydrofolate dehydrogenase/5,10-methenyltetrahydrofolate cyclohydrolase [Alphaproteobacteria bacterium]|nr:bifunctional 5,10-methylenetetrahydrofolate dehydrogenase/5,10-methenyltetrahydrofolate cyclohydrolase [Alphaproteobacteria bacterium]
MADAIIIDGKSIAEGYLAKIKQEVEGLPTPPCLAMVLVGENPASLLYVRYKQKHAESLGITSLLYMLPAEASEAELLHLVNDLNQNPQIDGVLVQLPLPEHIDEFKVISAIRPDKDVDGFTTENIGLLALKKDCLVPCTPLGCIKLLKSVEKDISGLNAVVVGRSNIVGRPLAQMLLNENCTVTVTHSHTKDLPDICVKADILAVAVGNPGMVKGNWIKPGAIVLDVGISYMPDKSIRGDVDFAEALKVAKAITPVPKGVGPMTKAMLMHNTVKAYKKRRGWHDAQPD